MKNIPCAGTIDIIRGFRESKEVEYMGEHLHEHAVIPRTDEEKDKVLKQFSK